MKTHPKFEAAARIARRIPRLKRDPARKQVAIRECIREILVALRTR